MRLVLELLGVPPNSTPIVKLLILCLFILLLLVIHIVFLLRAKRQEKIEFAKKYDFGEVRSSIVSDDKWPMGLARRLIFLSIFIFIFCSGMSWK